MLILSTILWLAAATQAAVFPFAFDGKIEGATADTAAYNTGGSLVVNGISVTIPKNLQFQLPASFALFKDIASGGYNGYEVSVIGNYVDGVPIAGFVEMSELLLHTGSGQVTSLAFDGAITLSTGHVLRINDPNAVYSAGYTSKPAFTADDANPSITAFSGFPVCVPRSASDAKCPSSNRPAGQASFNAPNPLLMAPIQVGDTVTYSGIRAGGETICYELLVENLQVLTPGGPAYIRLEDTLIGIFDAQPNGVMEYAESRFVGLTSNAAASFTISRIEVDPCTGEETEVTIGSATPRAGDIRLKWIWRADSTQLTPYTREYVVTASTGVVETNGGQILAGRYVTPVGELIFPESATPGTLSASNDFTQFTYLTKGLGPDASGNIWGPLSPWPGARAPDAPAACPTTPTQPTASPTATPISNAGADRLTRPGTRQTLAGTVSNAANFSSTDLTYEWTQSSGPIITLSGANTAAISFTVPAVVSTTNYTFLLVVKSTSNGFSSMDSVVVTTDPNGNDVVTIDSYTYTSSQGGTISVTAHSDVVDGTAKLSLFLNNPTAGAAITMVDGGGGKWSYSSRSTKQPSGGITVKSNFRGSATKTGITSKRSTRRKTGTELSR